MSIPTRCGPGSYFEPEYTEGRDAGSLTVIGSAAAIDGTVYAQAFPGERQLVDSQVGTGTSSVYGDQRAMQAAPSQLPAGGFLLIQAQSTAANGSSGTPGGADIVVQSASNYQTLPGSLTYGQTLQVAADGSVIVPARDPGSYLGAGQLGTINLSDALLSGSGFGSGLADHERHGHRRLRRYRRAGARRHLSTSSAGHKITVDGTVSAPGGQISLATYDGQGSVFAAPTSALGDYDVVVNGTLSVRGRWVNDYGVPLDALVGGAWLNGGSVTLYAAPRISTIVSNANSQGAIPPTSTGFVRQHLYQHRVGHRRVRRRPRRPNRQARSDRPRRQSQHL